MKRNGYIDWLKGLAIFLVVYGHCWQRSDTMFWFIYRFHMPLFFCISGYLFSAKKEFREFLKTKFKSLIIPYVVFFLISYLLTNFFIKSVSREESLNAFFLNGKYLTYVTNFALWYLILFFIASILFYIIYKNTSEEIFTLVILFAGLLTIPWFSFVKKIFGNDEYIPFSIQVLPAAIFFMGIGKIYKQNQMHCLKINNKIKITISFLLFLFGLYFSRKDESQIISITTYRYLISSILIIQFIVLLTKQNQNKVVRYVGRNSLVILGIHRVLIAILQEYKFDELLQKCKIEGDFAAILKSICCIFIICMCNEIYKHSIKYFKYIIKTIKTDKEIKLLN